VDIRIINVASAKSNTLAAGFAFTEKMAITALSPTQGGFTGGTRVTIDGNGFDTAGVAVVVGGVAAAPVFVSGTKIIAVTGAPIPTGCSNVQGVTSVVNINNGDHADGPQFTFLVPKPSIVSVSPSSVPAGTSTTVTVRNAFGTPKITLAGQGVSISGSGVTNADGTVTYTIVVPAGITLTQAPCGGAPSVSGQKDTPFDITYTSIETTCSDTLQKGLTVSPGPPQLVIGGAFVPFAATAAATGPPPTAFKPAPAQSVLFTNGGGGTVTVNSVTTAGTGCSNFTVTTPPTPATFANCEVFPIQVQYTPPIVSPAGTVHQCVVMVNTNAGNRTFALSGSVQ
jgi:hypothetical protein